MSSFKRFSIVALCGALLGFAAPRPTQAQELVIGLGIPILALDPHFANNSPTKAVMRHFFDALVHFDDNLQPVPALAVSWRTLNDTTWEFKLRPNVQFSDGAPLTADDVVASFERAPDVPNSPAPLGLFTRSIKRVVAVDPLTVHIETKYPDPLLITMVPEIAIISRSNRNLATADYNSGKAVVGTGPFVLKSYVSDDRVIMERNERYWGEKPDWKRVELRFITNDGTRVTTLLAGGVNLIENLPSHLVDRVKQSGEFSIFTGPKVRPVYLGVDVGGETTPFVKGVDPSPGAPANPLKDVRVRQALSLGINRAAIAERILGGAAVPAGQLLADGLFGTSSAAKADPFDPAKGKALLAEAGFPNGLTLTIHGPNNRLPNDSQVVQAIAQMWTRMGVAAQADVGPWNVYFPRTTKREFSIWLLSAAASVSEMTTALNSVVVTYDIQNGKGVNNRGRYSNKDVDALVEKAFRTLDDAERAKLLAKASEIAMAELAVIPLYFDAVSVAAAKGIEYRSRSDQFTLAMNAKLRR
jgi:peptide/nickel transport system substrate-binding protein